jgi:uncharacterized protein YjbI with pentapeptide repeats
MRSAKLVRANFGEANLKGVDLMESDVLEASFAGACLQDAKLIVYHLETTDRQGADMEGAELYMDL